MNRLNIQKVNRIFFIKFALFSTFCIELTSVPKDILLPIYGNVVGFILLFLLLVKNFTKTVAQIFFVSCIFIFYFILNPDFYFESIDPYKALFYAIISILLSYEFKQHNFEEILKDVFFKYLVFILFVYILGFGIDDAGGTNRIQGLMSEPSALSLIINFLFWTFLKEKKFKKLIFIVVISILTFSLVVYVQFVLFYLLHLLFKLNFKAIFNLFIIFLILLFSIFFINKIESDYWLINKAQAAMLFIDSGGVEGKNSRAIDITSILEEQNRNIYSFFLGNGPNYGVYYYSSKDMLTKTQNFPSILFFNFGIIGLLIGGIWILYGIFKLIKSNYYILFLSAVSYSLINTASGIVNDIYLFTLLFYTSSLIFNNFKSKFSNIYL